MVDNYIRPVGQVKFDWVFPVRSRPVQLLQAWVPSTDNPSRLMDIGRYFFQPDMTFRFSLHGMLHSPLITTYLTKMKYKIVTLVVSQS
ncbi:MAG: hypothetical protein B6D78_10345 [gamma proteobacterium symbiont of Ctena orbiculata]|nr:MAG: hypothetical protein B6D78_10345 [gamma proteobacterium symbiont of Ctena orbiculata]